MSVHRTGKPTACVLAREVGNSAFDEHCNATPYRRRNRSRRAALKLPRTARGRRAWRIDGGGQGRRLRPRRSDGRAHAARRRMPSLRRRHARRGARAARGRSSHASVPASGLLRRAGGGNRRARPDAVRLRRVDDRTTRRRGRLSRSQRFPDSYQDRQRRDAAWRDACRYPRRHRSGAKCVRGAPGGRLHAAGQRQAIPRVRLPTHNSASSMLQSRR